MNKISIEDLAKLIEYGIESRNLEYKSSTLWQDDFKAKITKSLIAMSNLRDGGRIIIGMEEQSDGSFIAKGIEEDHLESYKLDDIRDYVGGFAAPNVDFDLLVGEYKGNKYLVFLVNPFSSGPIICKKDNNVLTKGSIYIRTTDKKFSSAIISSELDMRELIEIAVDRMEQQLASRGRWVCPLPKDTVSQILPEQDKEKFIKQLEDLEN